MRTDISARSSLCKIVLIFMKSCAAYTSICGGRRLRRLGREREHTKSSVFAHCYLVGRGPVRELRVMLGTVTEWVCSG